MLTGTRLPAGSPAHHIWRLDRFGQQDTSRDESQLPQYNTAMAYNCDTSDGTLRRSSGCEPLQLPTTQTADTPVRAISGAPAAPWRLFRYGAEKGVAGRQEFLMLQCSDNDLYQLRIDSATAGWTKLTSGLLTEPVEMAVFNQNGSDLLIVANPVGQLLYWDGAAASLSLLPGMVMRQKTLCVHYSRVFAAGSMYTPFTVHYSAPKDCNTWNDPSKGSGSFAVFGDRGPIIKLLSFADHICVFHQFGISRITAYARESEFSASKVYASTGRILADSITECADRIIFASDDGLFAFNGSTAVPIAAGMKKYFQNRVKSVPVAAAYYNNRYYLSLASLLYEGQTAPVKQNMTIEYCLLDGSVTLHYTLAAAAMCPLCLPGYQRMVMVLNKAGYPVVQAGGDSFCGDAIVSQWNTPMTDLGAPEVEKKLKYIYVVYKGGPIVVGVGTPEGLNEYEFGGSGTLTAARADINRIKGRSFFVALRNQTGGEDFKVTELALGMDLYPDGR